MDLHYKLYSNQTKPIPPGCWKQAWRAIPVCSASVFLFTYFNDFYKTNYLKKIYRTDLRQFLSW